MRNTATLWLSIVVCLPLLASAQAAASNPDALARQVLLAIATNDQKALESLSIDQAEAKKYIWPTVAVRVSGGGMNAEKFSSMYCTSSRAALFEQLKEYGGKKFDLVKVNTGPAKKYKGYNLLPNPELTVRSGEGQEQILKLGSALLERDGTFRVASYYRAPATTQPKQ